MLVDRKLNEDFRLVESHVQRTAQACNTSGSAVIIIHDDKVVSEQYWGRHSDTENSKSIRNNSQFHVASVRKSYLGFAVAHAIVKGTGVTLLVIPDKNIAAVRMLNSFGSPPGYDYLADVRDFGDTTIKCL